MRWKDKEVEEHRVKIEKDYEEFRNKILNMSAGREMDALVAEKVMGWKRRKPTHGNCCTCQDCGQGHDECFCEFCPSEDIADAWRVVIEMRKRDIVTVLDNTCCEDCVSCVMTSSFFTELEEGDEGYVDVGSNGPAPLAISQSALLAVSNEM